MDAVDAAVAAMRALQLAMHSAGGRGLFVGEFPMGGGARKSRKHSSLRRRKTQRRK